jgi:hypothetical protein
MSLEDFLEKFFETCNRGKAFDPDYTSDQAIEDLLEEMDGDPFKNDLTKDVLRKMASEQNKKIVEALLVRMETQKRTLPEILASDDQMEYFEQRILQRTELSAREAYARRDEGHTLSNLEKRDIDIFEALQKIKNPTSEDVMKIMAEMSSASKMKPLPLKIGKR